MSGNIGANPTVQNYYHEYGGNDTCPLCTKHIDD
ncbi:hypothetical protein [Escherichia coli]